MKSQNKWKRAFNKLAKGVEDSFYSYRVLSRATPWEYDFLECLLDSPLCTPPPGARPAQPRWRIPQTYYNIEKCVNSYTVLYKQTPVIQIRPDGYTIYTRGLLPSILGQALEDIICKHKWYTGLKNNRVWLIRCGDEKAEKVMVYHGMRLNLSLTPVDYDFAQKEKHKARIAAGKKSCATTIAKAQELSHEFSQHLAFFARVCQGAMALATSTNKTIEFQWGKKLIEEYTQFQLIIVAHMDFPNILLNRKDHRLRVLRWYCDGTNFRAKYASTLREALEIISWLPLLREARQTFPERQFRAEITLNQLQELAV